MNGRPLRLLEYRTGSYFVDVQHAAELAARDGALAIVGANSSELSQAIAEVAEASRRAADLERLDGGRPDLGPADGPPAASCSGCAPPTT